MRRCRNCGKENDDSTKYCEECGKELISLSTGYKGKGLAHVKVEDNPWKDFLICILCILFLVFLIVGWYLLVFFFGDLVFIVVGIIMILIAIGWLIWLILAFKAWRKEIQERKERDRKKREAQNS